MSRRKILIPRNTQYKQATAIDTSTQEGLCELWHERIRRFADRVKLAERKQAAQEARAYIDGELVGREESVYLNEARPALEDMIFSSLPGLPPVQVEARQSGEGHENLAQLAAALIDATLNSSLCGAKKALLDAEWDEPYWGIAITKCALRMEHRMEWPEIAADPQLYQPHVEAALAENAAPELARVAESDNDAVHIQIHGGIVGLEDHIAEHMRRLGKRTVKYPIIRRVDPERFAYDPDAVEWSERTWEAELVEQTVSELQLIDGIRNLNPVNCPPVDEFDNTDGGGFDFEKTRVRVWHIHDLLADQYLIIPAGANGESPRDGVKPLLVTSWPYGGIEVYRAYCHRSIPGQIHGLATVQLILPIVRELALVNSFIRKHARRAANAKPILPRTELDQAFMADLTDPNKVAAFGPPGLVAMMKEWKPPSIPMELLQHRETLLIELRRMLGSDIMSQGGDTPHDITATEAGLRGQYHESRLERRKQTLNEQLQWAARACLLMYRDFCEEAIAVRILTPTGPQVAKLDPTAIPEDLIVSLDIQAISSARKSQTQQAFWALTNLATRIAAPGTLDAAEILKDAGQVFGQRGISRWITQSAPIIPPTSGQSGLVGQDIDLSRKGNITNGDYEHGRTTAAATASTAAAPPAAAIAG